ncbi:hypothetical protein AB835_00605 [Candidatus Endobugula sertula]|uniref:Uncharacterized protein n=1 Tax=Candidatus Endobugula sertula TaxID=62101 RepID=A0A1D2QTZ0_9GAMM|nr:hypothetical protein AB835_00605 [Candidatus Endobugula sertula]
MGWTPPLPDSLVKYDRVEESDILADHFEQTGKRIVAATSPILVLHDTTEFSYHRKKPEDIGFLSCLPITKKSAEELGRDYKSCGILLYASVAITAEGLPLELTATQCWTRQVFKEPNLSALLTRLEYPFMRRKVSSG